jgi:hypothetical protein
VTFEVDMPEDHSPQGRWMFDSAEAASDPPSRRLAFALFLATFLALVLFASFGAATVIGAATHAAGCGGG